MFITGIVNNPLTLLSRQQDIPLSIVQDDHCELLLERGALAEKEVDKNVEAQFNIALDRLADWRSKTKDDASLQGQ